MDIATMELFGQHRMTITSVYRPSSQKHKTNQLNKLLDFIPSGENYSRSMLP
jgi:hypothetical protein